MKNGICYIVGAGEDCRINFYLYCGTGGRMDHMIANLQALSFLSENGKHFLLGLVMSLSVKKAAYPLTMAHYLLSFREKKRRNIDYEKSIIYRWV